MKIPALPSPSEQMSVAQPAASLPSVLSQSVSKGSELQSSTPQASGELKDAFTDFVGQTMFGSMLASMRKTLSKPEYMHGGRTEEVFQQQMDQHIVEDLTKASADSFADPMFQLFNMQRR